MKSLKPLQILILGSSAIALLVFLLGFLFMNDDAFSFKRLLLLGVLIGLCSFAIFYFLIQQFITERLNILYRSIRKGKFDKKEDDAPRMRGDVIGEAEKATKNWSEENLQVITRLKEQEKFRREFLGNLAHELKTPVFSIQGYILTLLDGGLEDETVNRQFLERASKATDRMTTILEDLDKLTKLEAGRIELQLSHFDIVALVSDVFDELEMKAKKRKIKLRFAKEYDSKYVHADKSRITQVITNLISNSISYGSDKGETIVRFYLLDDIVTIEVSDNGPGIPEVDLPRLFERFYRVEKSRNRNEGGSGLGLAIAKHFVEAHGQTISVRSTIGVGSTFTFGLDRGKKR